MAVAVPAVRIFPMSDRAEGFVGRSIDDVQRTLFPRDLPRSGGRWRYPRQGSNADAGTIVLFQFKARVVACATFLRDEGADGDRAGTLCFDPASIRTFEPWDVAAMRQVWPSLRAFGHVKQRLNPTLYPAFRRRLRSVQVP